MAGEPNEQQQIQTPQGNEPEARNPDGSLKDQGSLTHQSGQEKPTNSDGSQQQTNDRSFLNRDPAKPEAKPDDKKPEVEGDKKPDDKENPQKTEGAPEKYADFTLPEGYKFDDKTLTDVTAAFKDLNLTQEQGQKLVDLYAQNSITASEAPYKLWADTQSSWVDQILSDFGETKAEEMRTDINKGIEAAFSPKLQRAFREAIDLTGAGSNPAMFEAFHTLFKPYTEGTPVRGNAPTKESQTAPKTDSRPSIAEAMYPHLVNNRAEQ